MKNNGSPKRETFKKIKQIEMGSWDTCWLAKDANNKDVVLTYLDVEKYKTRYQKEAVDNGATMLDAAKIADGKIAERINKFKERAKRAIGLGEHPNIAKTRLVAYDEEERKDFIVTDHIKGEPLNVAVKGMNANQIGRIWINVLSALSHIHDAELLHLNLKPRLIVVESTADGQYAAKLSDPGFLFSKGQHDYPLIGTAMTLAPELALEHRADERSDLYSIGVLMYYSYAGIYPSKRPSIRNGKDKLIRFIKTEVTPPPPSTYNKIKGTGHALDAIIMRLLEKKPDNRFKNADAAKRALLGAFPDLTEAVLVDQGTTVASAMDSIPE